MRHPMRWLIAVTVVFACPLPGVRAAAEEIAVGAGESVQEAVDKAPVGATITLAPGAFPEGVTIAKPLTLQGAGWEQTTIGPDKRLPLTQKQKDEFFAALDATSDKQERARIAIAFATGQSTPRVTVKSTKGVVLRGIKFRGSPTGDAEGGLTAESLVTFDDASGAIRECAVIGPFMNGVAVLAESDVKIENSLVAAMWGTGVAAGRRTKLHLSDSDVRNCYHRCVTLGTDDATIERCRISGSAWHGVRYDDCWPKILSNHIFGNARSGIYASGRTSATVRWERVLAERNGRDVVLVRRWRQCRGQHDRRQPAGRDQRAGRVKDEPGAQRVRRQSDRRRMQQSRLVRATVGGVAEWRPEGREELLLQQPEANAGRRSCEAAAAWERIGPTRSSAARRTASSWRRIRPRKGQRGSRRPDRLRQPVRDPAGRKVDDSRFRDTRVFEVEEGRGGRDEATLNHLRATLRPN